MANRSQKPDPKPSPSNSDTVTFDTYGELEVFLRKNPGYASDNDQRSTTFTATLKNPASE